MKCLVLYWDNAEGPRLVPYKVERLMGLGKMKTVIIPYLARLLKGLSFRIVLREWLLVRIHPFPSLSTRDDTAHHGDPYMSLRP